jgi:hypothetical protein
MKNKKIFFWFIALSAVMALAMTACFRDIPNNTDWIVKAKDKSGNVPLYGEADAETFQTTIPDGSVVEGAESAGSVIGSNGWSEYRYKVEYEGKTYYIREQDLRKQTKGSKAALAEGKREFKERKKKEWGQFFILLGITAGASFVFYKWNKTRSLRAFKKYYTQKRREFPWLENWIKQNGDPSVSRAKANSMMSVGIAIFVLLALQFITYIFSSISVTKSLVYLAISFGVCWLAGRKTVKGAGEEQPEAGLTLECPSCHCPHSWVMHRKEVIIDNVSTITTKTTRSGYGQGDIIDSAFEGFKQNGTTEKSTSTYDCRAIKDFECLNCGQTEHYVQEMELNNPPKTGVFKYNPPNTAWGYKED